MPAFLFMAWVAIVGPGIVGGGFDAVKAEGFKPAIEQAWHNRKPYDSGSLKNVHGNFGNQ